MMENFQIKSLKANEFSDLFTLDDEALAKIGAVKMIADQKPGFPCRVSLVDATVGEEVILMPYTHHQTLSPYQASGPIFIRKNAIAASFKMNEVPQMLLHRLQSIRAYDKNGIMKSADVMEGFKLKESLMKIFEDKNIAYIHIHNAKPGCYNCSVERA